MINFKWFLIVLAWVGVAVVGCARVVIIDNNNNCDVDAVDIAGQIVIIKDECKEGDRP